MNTYEEKFSFNIKRLRKKMKLTQKQLSDKLGYSEKTVSKWECMGAIPNIDALYKIAGLFNVTIDELFREDCIYLLGIDGGGTKTDIVLSDVNYNIKKELHINGCNPIDIGIENTKNILREGIYEVCSGIAFSNIVMYAGIAGGSSGSMKKELHNFFDEFGFKKFENGSDTQNIISAGIGEQDGVVMIMGTGNCAIAQHNGVQERVSGWGYLFDEGGSGYSIARDALASHFRYVDGSGEYTLFSDKVSEKYSDPQVLLGKLYDEGKKAIAAFSPLVFECAAEKDAVCLEVIKKNMSFAANVIKTAAAKVANEKTEVILAGGISSIPLAYEALMNALQNKECCNIKKLNVPPVKGALIYANKLASISKGE